jgi:hypothetical protein
MKNNTSTILLLTLPFFLMSCGQQRNKKELNAVMAENKISKLDLIRELELRKVTGIDDTMMMEEVILRATDTSIYSRDSLITIVKNPHLSSFETDTIQAMLKVIYGPLIGGDNRRDYYEVEPPRQRLIQQVVGLFSSELLTPIANGTVMLQTTPFSRMQVNGKFLCESERYFSQPTGCHCTGFPVGEDIIATAGHCINASNMKNKRFVFDFRMNGEKEANLIIDTNFIYTPVEVIKRGMGPKGVDFALIRVNKPIPENRRCTLASGRPMKDDKVFVIGHPVGLPVKYAGGAKVIDDSNENYFIADLDTYGGNSGSPVFNEKDEVIGILVRGSTDFVLIDDQSCFVSNWCPTVSDQCGGEYVSRLEQFQPYLN